MTTQQTYKEALSRARKELQEFKNKDCDDTTRQTAINIIHKIFPELKESESEDERMKKAIMHVLYENYTDAAVIEGVEIAEIIAWLEEQSKKMSADEVMNIRRELYQSGYNDGYKHGHEDEVKQLTNSHKREIDDAYLQGICDAKHELEKQGKKLDADEVIE